MTTVEAWFDADQQHGVVLDDKQAVEEFLARFAEQPQARLVALYLGDQLDGDFPSVEFLVGVGGGVPVGVLRVADADGLWVSRNPAGDQGGKPPVAYHYMGVGEEFPPDAELPLDEVRAAVLEYVRIGVRPTCVQWQPSL
ncbi:hypothetical protein GCM10010174_00100 [Kutzneria viridogrisea]|uniref:Immunity protein Imm1 n=1 Tax=Kutzneria viridogrisea TaxID=47990 RepID=A0ABR6BCJ6_9PSEU|nr:hypothetical protein [Kutzneria viridogrisea]